MRLLPAIMMLLLCSLSAQAEAQAQARDAALTNFEGELAAGQSYSHAMPQRMSFALLPITGGWRIAVTGVPGCDNVADITVPAESLQIVLPTPQNPYQQPAATLPPARAVRYALSCNDYKQFAQENECKAQGSKRMCTDMGAVAAGNLTLTVTSFTAQRRGYNAPAAFQSIKFTVAVSTPSPSGAN